MYRITTEEGKKEYLETVLYIKKQDNDTIVICNEEEAQGFLSKDSSIIYAMSGKGLEEQYETAGLQQITLDAFVDEYVGDAVNILLGMEESDGRQTNAGKTNEDGSADVFAEPES